MTANPTIGPGNMPICKECTEHLKHDVDHRIADKVESMCLPMGVMDDELHDLLKLRRNHREYKT